MSSSGIRGASESRQRAGGLERDLLVVSAVEYLRDGEHLFATQFESVHVAAVLAASGDDDLLGATTRPAAVTLDEILHSDHLLEAIVETCGSASRAGSRSSTAPPFSASATCPAIRLGSRSPCLRSSTGIR